LIAERLPEQELLTMWISRSRHERRLRLDRAFVSAICLLSAAGAAATPAGASFLNPFQSYIVADCGVGNINTLQNTLGVVASVALEDYPPGLSNIPTTTLDKAQTTVGGGNRPILNTVDFQDTDGPIHNIHPGSHGYLNYGLDIVAIRTLPWSIPFLGYPCAVDVKAEAIVAGGGMASASAEVGIGDFTIVTQIGGVEASVNGVGNDSSDKTVRFFGSAGEDFLVQLQVMSVAAAPDLGIGVRSTGLVVAQADPLFSFDQAAFDTLAASLGEPTFPLDQYLAFQYSDGILSVPEPGSLALSGLGVLIVGGGLLSVRADRPARVSLANSARVPGYVTRRSIFAPGRVDP
jgi:hypothetical protein